MLNGSFSERREAWASALESGEYKQAQGSLRTEEGFCCLGVACDLFQPEGWHADQERRYMYNKHNYAMPPQAVRDFFKISQEEADYLASRNDDRESFREIARRIRDAKY
jgi:hypothetical protein